MNMYEQRWQNANQICRRIDALLVDHMVFNADGERVFGFLFTETEISYSLNNPGLDGKCRFHVEIYNRNTDWDHGAHDTIGMFNSQFKEWEFCKKVSTEDALMPPMLKAFKKFTRSQEFAARNKDGEVSHICEYKRRRGNIVEAYIVNGGWTIRFDLATGKSVKHDIEICYTDPIPKKYYEDQIEWVAKRLGLTTK